MTLSTPPGSPTSSRIWASASIESGVCLAGLITIVQPAAIAGPILRVPIAIGKFHGVIEHARADGLLQRQHAARRRAAVTVKRPSMRTASSANQRKNFDGVGDLGLRLGHRLAHLERHQQREVVGALGDDVSKARRRISPRSRGGVSRHCA